jgi:hypothetical protein
MCLVLTGVIIFFSIRHSISEEMLIKENKQYLCLSKDSRYCYTCTNQTISIGEGEISPTSQKCVPPRIDPSEPKKDSAKPDNNTQKVDTPS